MVSSGYQGEGVALGAGDSLGCFNGRRPDPKVRASSPMPPALGKEITGSLIAGAWSFGEKKQKKTNSGPPSPWHQNPSLHLIVPYVITFKVYF